MLSKLYYGPVGNLRFEKKLLCRGGFRPGDPEPPGERVEAD